MEDTPDDFPLQEGGTDCGLFALWGARCLLEGVPFAFAQRDMNAIRRTVTLELLAGELMYRSTRTLNWDHTPYT